jgi:hypothetical protein
MTMGYRVEIKKSEQAPWEPGIDGYQDERDLTDAQASTIDEPEEAMQLLPQVLEKGPFAIRVVDEGTGLVHREITVDERPALTLIQGGKAHQQ